MNKATCNKVWLAAIAFIFALLMVGGSIVNVHAAEPAQADVKIDAQNFPDETFRNYVTQHFDSNKDDALSPEEIAAAGFDRDQCQRHRHFRHRCDQEPGTEEAERLHVLHIR